MTKFLSIITILLISLQNNVYAHPGHAGDHFHNFPAAFVAIAGSLIVIGVVGLLYKKKIITNLRKVDPNLLFN